jgi:hypothetical protein
MARWKEEKEGTPESVKEVRRDGLTKGEGDGRKDGRNIRENSGWFRWIRFQRKARRKEGRKKRKAHQNA